MSTVEKELKQIYNFYQGCTEGFVTPDGYAVVPFGNQFMVIYEGEQLKICRNENSSLSFINKHRKTF